MLRFLPTAAIALVGLLMFGCKSGRSVLVVRDLPNYDTRSSDHLLFLNFRISGKPGGNEHVELASASVANGRMKNLAYPVHFPVQIKAIPRYSTSALEREMVFEHPLHRSVEVSDPSGHMRREEMRANEGTLMIRMPLDSGLNRLELFSVTPEKGSVKIYTLSFN
ncbi:hypothetical protein J2Y45_002015 [Dyadobacter sp. BE34]|uniref:DUF5625 domain-containing protein n=1 Tax=Dyadobacter fermentans TaxID=94254 RepID=A0ABU1QWY8_9BACT|nr:MULTISPECIES: hypothetical protein [Dyadobacter]MDR6805676.1 hypothetical protein [Dyadobacter fermentans]MDR7042564.1 hypothetical protein [Dyadobacter sp. BE242]MDR7196876.1 hypothetical protein [Dyadobacter sp. BE34]MDR7215689.1 hypothetical protein [Dyadobacter sp. BE31]MDR7263225.1 hypothetical protein [Dyadobacter sp. BE32]